MKVNDYDTFSYHTKNRVYPTASPTNYGENFLDLSGSISHSPIFEVGNMEVLKFSISGDEFIWLLFSFHINHFDCE